jgi:DNA-binding MarR family transcriptional regulator
MSRHGIEPFDILHLVKGQTRSDLTHEIEDRLKITNRPARTWISRLLEAGVLAQVVDQEDRRRKNVVLTNLGQGLLAQSRLKAITTLQELLRERPYEDWIIELAAADGVKLIKPGTMPILSGAMADAFNSGKFGFCDLCSKSQTPFARWGFRVNHDGLCIDPAHTSHPLVTAYGWESGWRNAPEGSGIAAGWHCVSCKGPLTGNEQGAVCSRCEELVSSRYEITKPRGYLALAVEMQPSCVNCGSCKTVTNGYCLDCRDNPFVTFG